MSPEITCSTCRQCGKDFQRDDRMQFNPLCCYSCMGLSQMQGQYANAGHYNTAAGQFSDLLYGNVLSHYFNGWL